jgi:hypothetical protein
MSGYNVEDTIVWKYCSSIPNDNFEQIHGEAWVWHNFLSKEECNSIVDEALSKEWQMPDRVDLDILKDLTPKISSGFKGDVRVKPFDHLRMYKEGQGMLPHTDIYGWQNRILNGIVDKNYEKETVEYSYASFSTLIYFNDNYTGGELVYPEYNIEYKPKAGDLLIHSPEVIHGVKKVKSGLRYFAQAAIDQMYLMDKEFHDSFKIPKTESSNIVKIEGDFDFHVLGATIHNKRLKEWAKTQDNFLEYAN